MWTTLDMWNRIEDCKRFAQVGKMLDRYRFRFSWHKRSQMAWFWLAPREVLGNKTDPTMLSEVKVCNKDNENQLLVFQRLLTVCTEILFGRSYITMVFPNKLISVIKMLYQGFSTQVLCDEELTETFQVKTGVKQGCVLSPFGTETNRHAWKNWWCSC